MLEENLTSSGRKTVKINLIESNANNQIKICKNLFE